MLKINHTDTQSRIPAVGDVWYHRDNPHDLFIRIEDDDAREALTEFHPGREIGSVTLTMGEYRYPGKIVRTENDADNMVIFKGQLSQ